ncbi:hypothetical protein P3S67_024723 [Capsicum chacoense]
MENFFKKVNYSQSSSSNVNVNRSCLITDLDLGSLKADPEERRPISDYDPRIRDEVRKYYIEKGSCQPILKPYPSSEIGGRMCQFASSWFKGSHSTWLEYSVEKDAAYCLCCYLFKNEFVHETTGDFYASKGFSGWNKALERFRLHVDKVNSVLHKCYNKMLDLSNHRQSIQVVLDKHSEKSKSEYRMRLEASINVARLILYYGLPFQGHDESESSSNQGIRDLAKALVEANLVENYSLLYLLVKLILIVPVATTTVERAFSSMKHIKNEVRNSIGDQYLNGCLVCYIERDVFANVSNDVIVDRFQNMKTRRGQLSVTKMERVLQAPDTVCHVLCQDKRIGRMVVKHRQRSQLLTLFLVIIISSSSGKLSGRTNSNHCNESQVTREENEGMGPHYIVLPKMLSKGPS